MINSYFSHKYYFFINKLPWPKFLHLRKTEFTVLFFWLFVDHFRCKRHCFIVDICFFFVISIDIYRHMETDYALYTIVWMWLTYLLLHSVLYNCFNHANNTSQPDDKGDGVSSSLSEFQYILDKEPIFLNVFFCCCCGVSCSFADWMSPTYYEHSTCILTLIYYNRTPDLTTYRLCFLVFFLRLFA